MKPSTFIVVGFFLTFVFMLPTAAIGQEPMKVSKPIDAATVLAYEKLGCEYGGWIQKSLVAAYERPQPWFWEGREHAAKGLPGFRYVFAAPRGKLPSVNVPFGIEFALADSATMVAQVKELAPLENLVMLDVGLSATDEVVKAVAELKNLRTLSMSASEITNSGLKHLASMKQLTSLHFAGHNFTDDGLKELVGLNNLTTLSLWGSKISDAGMQHISRLGNLERLYIGNTNVSDDGLKQLAGLKNLTHLYFYKTKVTDAGLTHLTGMKNLRFLGLGSTEVSDKGMKEVAKLSSLRKLSVNDTRVGDPGLRELTLFRS